jgi:hypothetical protein
MSPDFRALSDECVALAGGADVEAMRALLARAAPALALAARNAVTLDYIVRDAQEDAELGGGQRSIQGILAQIEALVWAGRRMMPAEDGSPPLSSWPAPDIVESGISAAPANVVPLRACRQTATDSTEPAA